MNMISTRAEAILGLPGAREQTALAEHLAHKTSMTVEAARGALQAAYDDAAAAGAAAARRALGIGMTAEERRQAAAQDKATHEAAAQREATQRQADYDAGAAAAKAALVTSSPSAAAHQATKAELDYAEGAAEARRLLGKA